MIQLYSPLSTKRMSVYGNSGREGGHGRIDAIDPKRTRQPAGYVLSVADAFSSLG
jgi:hypothetical protein